MEKRIVIDRINTEDQWEYGHHETRKDETSEWRLIAHSHYVKNTKQFWFQKPPLQIMTEDIGIETTLERANNFAAASDNNPDVWYYLRVASYSGPSDEALKWIMGAIAAEIKIRNLKFIDLPKVIPAFVLSYFVAALEDGRVARNFSKQIFSELMTMRFAISDVSKADTLFADPRFKEVDSSDIENLVDKIITDNPDQFEKARENPKLVQWFVGQAMKASQGKAPAAKVMEIVNQRLTA